ncbi:alpha/beta fold hydrolase [Streptomyces sp. NPDC059524]|uniref:alpha/beta fold hydrolase n=1 Tax=Streptomyces sp. NPDC059524 TaxID=3346856 RepID=UPI0036B85042
MTPAARSRRVLCALTATAATLATFSTPTRAAPAPRTDTAETHTGAHPSTTIRFGACPESVPTPPAPDRVECGTLDVPLDRDDPGGGKRIGIAVSRVPASGTAGERRGILLVNPGGPGGSGLPYAVTKRAKLPESVRRAYDVIGFDPRGSGHSAPADCGATGGLFDSPGADPVPVGKAAEKTYLASLDRMADDCAIGVADALPHLSTAATVRDMDAVRAALGEPRTSFLGVSYGSYLGAAYAARFPHRVDRMVLDSVVGPWDWHDFDGRQSRELLRQREVFFAWAARHENRFGLGGDAAAVRSAYERTRRGLAARPQDGFGPAEFDRAVYRALGRTERWAPLADGVRAYLRDGGVAGLRPAEPFGNPGSRTFEAANRSVKCADGPGPTPSRVIADLHRIRREDPQPVLTGWEAAACAYWHHRPHRRTPLGSPAAPPVLLVASEHDPVTPIEGARQLRHRLPGSRLITLHEDYSHGVFASRGNACVDRATAAYLIGGTAPRTDVHCTGPGLPTP